MTTTVAYQNTLKTVLLAKLEVTENVDAAPTIANAMLCQALDIKANPTVLERPNYAPTLSKDKIGIGRLPCVLTFTKELKASGVVGTPPELDALLQACAMQRTIVAAGATTQISAVAGVNNQGPAVAIVGSTAPGGTIFDTYRVLVTTAGASGAAKGLILSDGFPAGDPNVAQSLDFTNYSNTANGTLVVNTTSVIAPAITLGGTWVTGEIVEFNFFGTLFRYVVKGTDTTNTILATSVAAVVAADTRYSGTAAAAGVITGALAGTAAPVTLTSATPLTLGTSGAAITPTWAGNLVAGDFYDVTLARAGVTYTPVSFNVPSVTLYVYQDGTLHKITGARGTFKIDGKASDYAKVQFTFTGNYNEPVDAALPTGMQYEPTRPVKCELMNFTVKGLPTNYGETWSLDVANTVSLRDDYNAFDGWAGALVTDRKPKMMADPESRSPSVYNPWKRMEFADIIRIYCQVGKRAGPGQLVNIQADAAQYDKSDYKNRTNIRTWDMSFALARITDSGDNEFSINFA